MNMSTAAERRFGGDWFIYDPALLLRCSAEGRNTVFLHSVALNRPRHDWRPNVLMLNLVVFFSQYTNFARQTTEYAKGPDEFLSVRVNTFFLVE